LPVALTLVALLGWVLHKFAFPDRENEALWRVVWNWWAFVLGIQGIILATTSSMTSPSIFRWWKFASIALAVQIVGFLMTPFSCACNQDLVGGYGYLFVILGLVAAGPVLLALCLLSVSPRLRTKQD
jgi:hypothetical protein